MFNKKHFWERLSIIAGIVATIVSGYTLWTQTKTESISISMSILSSEKVTDIEMVPGVKANFTYQGRDVLGLWKIKVRLVNSSGRNLIGVGTKSDLLYDSIPIVLNEEFKIIDINKDVDNVGIIPKLQSDNNFAITFEQWGETESATLTMYLEQLTEQNNTPTLEAKSKSLINGSVVIVDNSDNFYIVKKKKPRFDIPNWLEKSTGLITTISVISMVTIIFSLVWNTPIEFMRLQKWKKNYSDSFNQHIDLIINEIEHSDVKEMLESYKKQPYKAPNWVWSNYTGQRYQSSPITETLRSTVIVFIISLIIFVSLMIKMTV
ncbi:hypothetical protein BTO01_22855 [Vibrio jasicida]|uniref:hypothetical protein n=1 Tax=Vibrio jasicida TaxID=766224 RepID=UPI000CF41D46|nr:hypothetical protein [Vibrio jasicida]PQJ55518.1 hypothetical protein BTO01_22855 [Vibrio jasicida]